MVAARDVSESPSRSATGGDSRHRWWLIAIVAGALLGPLDLWLQVVAPYPVAHLFNSPAVWAAAAFGYGWWARDRVTSPLGAVIVLVIAVEAYYFADVVARGASRANLTSPTAVTWLTAGVVAGIVFGTAGAWAVNRSGWRAVFGRAALPAVFGAEAVYNGMRVATEPADGRPDDLVQFAILLTALGIGVLMLLVRDLDRRTALRVVGVAAVASVAVGMTAAAAVEYI